MRRLRVIGVLSAVVLAAAVSSWLLLASCSGSGSGPGPEVAEALDRLPAALEAAEDALEEVRPILTREELELEPAEREAVEAAIGAMEGVLELGRALARDAARASSRGGWAWADAVLRAVASLARWLKDIGVPVPDAVVTAADAASLLVPVIGGAVGGGG